MSLSDADLEAIEKRHRDGRPCDPTKLLAELRSLREENAGLADVLRAICFTNCLPGQTPLQVEQVFHGIVAEWVRAALAPTENPEGAR